MNNVKQLSGIDGKYVLLGGDFNLPDIDWEEGSVKSNPQLTLKGMFISTSRLTWKAFGGN